MEVVYEKSEREDMAVGCDRTCRAPPHFGGGGNERTTPPPAHTPSNPLTKLKAAKTCSELLLLCTYYEKLITPTGASIHRGNSKLTHISRNFAKGRREREVNTRVAKMSVLLVRQKTELCIANSPHLYCGQETFPDSPLSSHGDDVTSHVLPHTRRCAP